MDFPQGYKKWDLFISHASEDKEDVARPLAHLLNEKGYKVWFDEFTLQVGDSISEAINEGLAESKYGIVVISQAFIEKKWPRNELSGLFVVEGLEKRIIPVWHKVSRSQVAKFSPVLADRLALTTEESIEFLVSSIQEKIGRKKLSPEPIGVAGYWRGISGRLLLMEYENSIVGDYDWFGQPWVGALQGVYDGQILRFSWDWRVDKSNGIGFFFRVRERIDLRSESFKTYGLVGGWFYGRDAGVIDDAITQYRKIVHGEDWSPHGPRQLYLPRIPEMRFWAFLYSDLD